MKRTSETHTENQITKRQARNRRLFGAGTAVLLTSLATGCGIPAVLSEPEDHFPANPLIQVMAQDLADKAGAAVQRDKKRVLPSWGLFARRDMTIDSETGRPTARPTPEESLTRTILYQTTDRRTHKVYELQATIPGNRTDIRYVNGVTDVELKVGCYDQKSTAIDTSCVGARTYSLTSDPSNGDWRLIRDDALLEENDRGQAQRLANVILSQRIS
jgi:hypothetical protein